MLAAQRAKALAAVAAAVLAWNARAAAPGADYVRDLSPSPAAKAYFGAVAENPPARRIARTDPGTPGADDAFFTEDGSISIPPHGMISFKLRGRCMDPHLPAPAAGEPMQFVDSSKLIPQRLRQMYDNLVYRMSRGDQRVAAANPQHLVWAIRTAGTEEPYANILSGAQLEILDECAGRRGAFLKFHEKELRRNARRNRKGRQPAQERISVGNLSYDASDLGGTNAERRIETHISELTEMGRRSTVRMDADFRYGEIDEELYSDIVCEGGLSFSARVLNASARRKEFRAADFAAQVGNGANGGMRQRVTMGTPDEIVFVRSALREGVEVDVDATLAEIEGREEWRARGKVRGRRTRRGGEGRISIGKTTETTRKTRRDVSMTVSEIEPVSPVEPVAPVEMCEAAANETAANQTVAGGESLVIRVISLEYDNAARKGVAVIEVVSGSFNDACRHIRENFDAIIREEDRKRDDVELPTGAKLEIETVAIDGESRIEAKFLAKEAK